MQFFKNNPNKIHEFLNDLSDERRKILFGDSQKFELLFKQYKVSDKVSI